MKCIISVEDNFSAPKFLSIKENASNPPELQVLLAFPHPLATRLPRLLRLLLLPAGLAPAALPGVLRVRLPAQLSHRPVLHSHLLFLLLHPHLPTSNIREELCYER